MGMAKTMLNGKAQLSGFSQGLADLGWTRALSRQFVPGLPLHRLARRVLHLEPVR
jgi:hypothetical protein